MTAKSINIADSITAAVQNVTKAWTKQRRAEERDASRRRHRFTRLVRYREITIKEAAFRVMQEAYLKASDGGRLPTRPRQIMYAARPQILALTDKQVLDDRYFTQTLLPDYVRLHPSQCWDWDIVWDARGHFTEPHTGHETPLGTLEVRTYLGLRAQAADVVTVDRGVLYPTNGPEHRFSAVLFIEKEGFSPLFTAERLAERYDLAIMSTKGMSVTAARMLLDRLCHRGVQLILVLHDFDVSGFSILGTSNRRWGRNRNRQMCQSIGGSANRPCGATRRRRRKLLSSRLLAPLRRCCQGPPIPSPCAVPAGNAPYHQDGLMLASRTHACAPARRTTHFLIRRLWGFVVQ